jgi:hypothetical protein
MDGDFDPNVIVAEFLKQNLDSLVEGAKSVDNVSYFSHIVFEV